MKNEWIKYARTDGVKLELALLKPGQMLTDVSNEVLSAQDVANDLGYSLQYVRVMFTDIYDLPLRNAEYGGKFKPLALGTLRPAPGARSAPGAYVITSRMLAAYKGCNETTVLPIKIEPWEAMQILTLKQAAEKYKIGIGRLRKAIKAGEIQAKQIGIWVLLVNDLLLYLAAPPKKQNRRRLFTDEQIIRLRALREQGLTLPQVQGKASTLYGVQVNESSISRLLAGKTYSHVTEVQNAH